MTASPEGPPEDSRTEDVRTAGGIAALAITILTASSVNAAAQAVVLAAAKGKVELDGDGIQVIVNAFLTTAPLAIAVAIAALGTLRLTFTGSQATTKLVVLVAVAIGIGLALGNVVYESVYGAQLVVNTQDLNSTVARFGGPFIVRILVGIGWFLVGYFDFFGPGHFLAAFVAGGTAAYVMHRYLPIEARAQF